MIRTGIAIAAALLALAPAARAQTTHQVQLFTTTFTPASLTINVGDTVQWVWVTGLHDVVSGVGGVPDGNFVSGAAVLPPQTYSVTFDAAFLAANPMPGNFYPYYCTPHLASGMIGDITVNAPVAPNIAPYGCGTNPLSSLVSLSGQPQVGQTWTVGVDNPLGTQPAGSLAFVAVASAPDPNFPCGTPIPGFGMSAPGALGELLVSAFAPNPILVLGPSVWLGAGNPAAVPVVLPADPALAGLDFFFQGVIADITFTSGIFLGFTEGLQATIGS
jgi:plastocyanin